MITGCSDVRQALGVYVVGAIEPGERALVDQHLAVCGACRDELAGLAGLPALLGRVTLDEVERGAGDGAALTPPARILDSMLAEVAGRRRRWRRREALLAVAASIVLVIGGAAGAGVESLVSGPKPAKAPAPAAAWPPWITVTGQNPTTHVIAKVKYQSQRWGTAMSVWVTGVGYGTRCQVFVTDSAGRRVPAGGWEFSDDKRAWYPGSTSFPARSITSFQITAHGETVVTVPVA